MRRALTLGAVALVALSLVACGSDRSSVATAPSNADVVVPSGAESIVTPQRILPGSAVATTTPIAVTSLVSGTSCPNLSFTVYTYMFRVGSSTHYTGGACTDIKAGSKINFSGSRETETSTVFNVAALSFVTDSPTPPPSTPNPIPVNTEGTITALGNGMCPELQFFFGSYAFNVSNATQYSGGVCGGLRVGSKLTIVGSRRDGESFVRVSSLAFRDSTPPPNTPPSTPPPTPDLPTPVSIEVTVSSLVAGTSCPTRSFMVGPYKVNVSTATIYEYGACTNIVADVKLKLTGVRQGDGPIVASRIEFRNTTNPTTPAPPTEPRRPVEGEAVITALRSGTSCPALEFYLGSYLIKLDASTAFESGACSDLGIGMRVHVKGMMNTDGSVQATLMDVQSQAPGYPVAEGEGRVSTLFSSTSCPTLKFMIEDYTVTLTTSTTFVGGTCGDVVVGRMLGVRGVITGEKQALATQVVFKND